MRNASGTDYLLFENGGTLSGHQISSDIEAMRRTCVSWGARSFLEQTLCIEWALPVATACVISQGRAGEMHGPMVLHSLQRQSMPKYWGLWEDGADLQTSGECSLTNFGTPGYNTAWKPRALSCFAYFLVFAIQGHSIWCLVDLDLFLDHPGSAPTLKVWGGPCSMCLREATGYTTCQKCHAQNSLPCRALCRALCRVPSFGWKRWKVQADLQFEDRRRPFLWVKIWHAPWQHDATGYRVHRRKQSCLGFNEATQSDCTWGVAKNGTSFKMVEHVLYSV